MSDQYPAANNEDQFPFAAIVALVLVAKRFWNAPAGSTEELEAAQEAVAGFRHLQEME